MKKTAFSPDEAFRRRLAKWTARLKAQPRQVVIMQMTRKWASCSARGRVCFARNVLDLPSRLQDYIIVHELLHLLHPNHCRIFKSLLRAYLPNADALAQRLPKRQSTAQNYR